MQQRYISALLLILSLVAGTALFAQGNNFKDYIVRKGDNIQQKTNRNLFIKVTADKTSCYVGEPLVVTYKLYSRLGNISSIAKNPSFNGFSVIDLQEPEVGNSSSLEMLNGREYYVSIIRKAQLYALQPGTSQLGQAVVESRIRFTREEFIAQFDENGKPEFIAGATTATACFDTTALIGNEPLSVNIKPLPSAAVPASFNGAVGRYRIDALIEKDSFTTDDAGKLKILLSGEGNMTLVPAPEFEFPKGLESYEPMVKDGLNKLVVPVSGSKIFDYTFISTKEGDYIIPSIAFSFFDIDSGRYKTISTRPVTVHIKKGTGTAPVIASEKSDAQQDFGATIFTHRWMIVLPVGVLIIAGLFVWLQFDRRKQQKKIITVDTSLTDESGEVPLPVNPLEQSELMLVRNEPRLFYQILDKELHIFLAQQLHLPAEAISKKSIIDAMDKKGIAVADSLAAQKLLDAISLQLYTPFADEANMQEYYVEAVRLTKVLQ
jgi:hypothetical protein